MAASMGSPMFRFPFPLHFFIYPIPTARQKQINMADIREFTTDVSLYEKGRPEYSKESVEFLLSCVGALPSANNEATKLLEIAAGTGKFTRVMAEILTEKKANVKVIASDSQEAMCHMFRRCIPTIEILRFPAENIGKKGFVLWLKQSGTPLEWAYEGVAIFQYAEYKAWKVWQCTHEASVLKKLIAHTKIVALHAAALV